MIEQFFVVWNETGNNPTFKHTTMEAAKKEAERLASQYGGEFHVLAACGTARRTNVVFEEVDNIPF